MFRINEAIAYAEAQGNKKAKRDIAMALWPNDSQMSRIVKINRLCNGDTQRIDPSWVSVICSITGVSSDFLLGLTL